jgi:hypothetical protein
MFAMCSGHLRQEKTTPASGDIEVYQMCTLDGRPFTPYVNDSLVSLTMTQTQYQGKLISNPIIRVIVN